MALINCTECKKEISDKATSCPGCGAPIREVNNLNKNNTEPNQTGISRSSAALLGFLLGFILLYAGCGVKADDFTKPANLIVGVIVGTFFAILFALIFGRKLS
jgi:hypothetical protein